MLFIPISISLPTLIPALTFLPLILYLKKLSVQINLVTKQTKTLFSE